MNISSIILKIPETENDYSCYCSLSLLTIIINDGFIDRIILYEARRTYIIYNLEEVNGQIIKIADLKCKTFAEFVVAIDVNNLNHNV